MATPDRDDDPVESWEYEGHECHVYAATGPSGEETTWAGYAKTKLPEGLDPADLDVHVPGDFTSGAGDGWVGFASSDDARDEARTKADVEDLVDRLIELESGMDG